MARFRHEIHLDMRVVDADDNELGHICEIDGTFFKIRPASGGAVQIPLAAIQNVLSETVILSMTAGQVLGRSWTPPRARGAGGSNEG